MGWTPKSYKKRLGSTSALPPIEPVLLGGHSLPLGTPMYSLSAQQSLSDYIYNLAHVPSLPPLFLPLARATIIPTLTLRRPPPRPQPPAPRACHLPPFARPSSHPSAPLHSHPQTEYMNTPSQGWFCSGRAGDCGVLVSVPCCAM